MSTERYVQVSFSMPYKTVQQVDVLALDNGLSRANMMMKLIEGAINREFHSIERSSVTVDGVMNKKGLPMVVKEGFRKLL